MKDSLGEDMPCVTRENVGELCYTLTRYCNPSGPIIGGITFIPEEDPELPPTVKALIMSAMGGFSIPLTDEQVLGALQSLENLVDYGSRSIMALIGKFCGIEGLAKVCEYPEKPKRPASSVLGVPPIKRTWDKLP